MRRTTTLREFMDCLPFMTAATDIRTGAGRCHLKGTDGQENQYFGIRGRKLPGCVIDQ